MLSARFRSKGQRATFQACAGYCPSIGCVDASRGTVQSLPDPAKEDVRSSRHNANVQKIPEARSSALDAANLTELCMKLRPATSKVDEGLRHRL